MVIAMTNAPIDSFRGDYRFLSNFWIEPDGTHVEGEFQAAKANSVQGYLIRENDARRLRFLGMSPGQAKREGRKLRLRPDWEQVKVVVMRHYVREKFMDHPELAAMLLATGDRELIEGNTWGDTFWGVCDGQGENHLGRVLMEVRDELHPQEPITLAAGAAGGAAPDFERMADRLNDAWAVLRTVSITDGQAAIERHGIEHDEERSVGYFDGALADDLLEIAAYLRKRGERT